MTAPVYPEVTPEREVIFNNIFNEITDSWSNQEGVYKVYIRNYSENSRETYAVVENDQGTDWYFDVYIENDGYIFARDLGQAGSYMDKEIGLIKEYAAFVKEFNTQEYQSDAFLDSWLGDYVFE